MKNMVSSIILLSGMVTTCSLSQTNDPRPNPESVVIEGNVRFTILTPQLIRMEWSRDSTVEDRPSLVFINRNLERPEFSMHRTGRLLTIRTGKLELAYETGSGKFTSTNLHVRLIVGGTSSTWHPGMEDTANLGGTIRTLDGAKGPVPLDPGLISRDGWVVVDDSDRPLFDNSDWPWVIARPAGERQDLYFFGYGHEYRRALLDFTRVAGKIPMPPRFAFGLWWSRYWAYTDEELKDLVHEFEDHNVPLDVLVIDMDWHNTFDIRWGTDKRDQAGQRLGWTGYTWNRNYFPDPAAFLSWCDSKGLKTPLNIHPASGIQPHEEVYPAMARAMGIDPETRNYVPFDIVDKKFAENYMNIVLRPLEKQGVDFWWLDWQQWSTTKIPGVTPTWWLNYVFFTDMERQGKARPLLFHRWGGLGNHRYQIGFSGDATSNWEVLDFESYFTSTAANVGFGYWSHDIGGHIPGPVSPEMYTRWIQFGTFSPILRTHTTKNPLAERRIWGYPDHYFTIMRDAILLRYSLIPYIYTASRKTYDTGVSICHPLYYDYPERPEAYEFKDQYMFGDDLLVAPIAAPIDSMSMLVQKRLWLPAGQWYEWFTGTMLQGPGTFTRSFALDEIPVYAKAGAVIPMQPEMKNAHEKPVDPLIVTIFPGTQGMAEVYEDEGNTNEYRNHAAAMMTITHSITDNTLRHIEIVPAPHDSESAGQSLRSRSYEIRLPGTWPPESVTVNGKQVVYRYTGGQDSWRYEGENLVTVITTRSFLAGEKVTLDIRIPSSLARKNSLLNGVPGMIARLRRSMPLMNSAWPKDWSPDIFVNAAQTGNRISLHPETALRELERLRPSIQEALAAVDSLHCTQDTIRRVRKHCAGLIDE